MIARIRELEAEVLRVKAAHSDSVTLLQKRLDDAIASEPQPEARAAERAAEREAERERREEALREEIRSLRLFFDEIGDRLGIGRPVVKTCVRDAIDALKQRAAHSDSVTLLQKRLDDAIASEPQPEARAAERAAEREAERERREEALREEIRNLRLFFDEIGDRLGIGRPVVKTCVRDAIDALKQRAAHSDSVTLLQKRLDDAIASEPQPEARAAERAAEREAERERREEALREEIRNLRLFFDEIGDRLGIGRPVVKTCVRDAIDALKQRAERAEADRDHMKRDLDGMTWDRDAAKKRADEALARGRREGWERAMLAAVEWTGEGNATVSRDGKLVGRSIGVYSVPFPSDWAASSAPEAVPLALTDIIRQARSWTERCPRSTMEGATEPVRIVRDLAAFTTEAIEAPAPAREEAPKSLVERAKAWIRAWRSTDGSRFPEDNWMILRDLAAATPIELPASESAPKSLVERAKAARFGKHTSGECLCWVLGPIVKDLSEATPIATPIESDASTIEALKTQIAHLESNLDTALRGNTVRWWDSVEGVTKKFPCDGFNQFRALHGLGNFFRLLREWHLEQRAKRAESDAARWAERLGRLEADRVRIRLILDRTPKPLEPA